ncbi:DUF2796 domain-containing protein [Rhizobacter sp. Root1221]|uniref:DUF2796 domain-containing protein n=1 Tax=Rhizobacter sp. Root1221 TaxID=1736433 RepID=UPI0006FD47D4|nr:DUF2796 domain-containing protein [Rhizobacter sp. Root1221]KQV81221.1 hypothetical protein ASC87_09845 [Rhizobacter sp. Root1221]
MRLRDAAALASLWLAASLSLAAEHAHVHGTARLDVAIDAGKITLQLETPLDNLVGFERAPRTDAERQRVADMLATLRQAGALFTIDPAAQCTPGRVDLVSAALQLGPAGGSGDPDGHADLDGTFEFNCARAGQAAYIDVGLFAFPHLKSVDVQAATPRGQFRRQLVRPDKRLVLSK